MIRTVKFTIEVEYRDWWNDDIGEWALPTEEQVIDDVSTLIDCFGDETTKVYLNDTIVYNKGDYGLSIDEAVKQIISV